MGSHEASEDALLSSLVNSLHYVPVGARRITAATELPTCLQSRAGRPAGRAWQAWAYGARIWFVSARSVSSGESVVVFAEFFDMDGRCACAGIWRRDRWRKWVLATPCCADA